MCNRLHEDDSDRRVTNYHTVARIHYNSYSTIDGTEFDLFSTRLGAQKNSSG